jgi:membrane protein implicated in regulation of membrane protease activity
MKNVSLRVSALALGAMLLASCGTTRINRVLNDPSRYRNRDVRVEGTVTNVIGALNTGVYQVDDGTGKIFVLSNRGIPNKGVRVSVVGDVQQGINVLGRSYGTVIRERDHRVRY